MREVSFVNKLKFNFAGSVTKRALVIGDADNDQCNELVCANLQGDLAIFKDRNPSKYAYASELGMVTACIVGDVINANRNCIAAINTEGWLFIFDLIRPGGHSVSRNVSPDQAQEVMDTRHQTADDGSARDNSARPRNPIKLNLTYDQRMPANCKDLLLADLDGDGQNELIVGLTDRVLRTYKWITIGPDRGKFVGLYKWEFADQIGAVSLNPSQHENCQDIIVAQPGGTYAKLECFDKKPTSMSLNSTPAPPQQSSSLVDKPKQQQPQQQQQGDVDNINNQQQQDQNVLNDDDDNVRTEYISKLTPEYHQLALAQMRNHHISTEVLGGIRDKKNPNTHSLIVIATLDGTLMLVNKDEILWSIQVDHQLFALAMIETTKTLETADGHVGSSSTSGNDNNDCRPKLSQSESTCTIVPNSKFDNNNQQQQLAASNSSNINQTNHDGDSMAQATASSLSASANYCDPNDSNRSSKRKMTSQYFAVCAWNGKTYIIDEERNYLRFKFDEAVSAFTAGNYYFDGAHHSTLVYATFNNQLVLYYDVLLNQIRPMYLLNEILSNPQHDDLLKKLEKLNKKVLGDSVARDSDARQLQDLLHGVLYTVADKEFKDSSLS